ncbi:collagen alpha-1(XII) chain-like [Mercenaria mercenaria]|uniref:collagen alpha-1(XII) chain-like n=1 Tax=Mercenaria mercenaria TaxID=6596 RepID=UPI00234F1F5C|nr:collagen alpha-1(XII) chain-like [Mercenaria mercenaria]
MVLLSSVNLTNTDKEYKMASRYLLFALVYFVGAQPACEDLNTAACSLFLASKPDLCQDQALSANCKRFCGQCPLVCYDCPTAVSSPDNCTATKTCALGEVCMQKTHKNPDGSKEFIMSCESKTTCEGLSLGFHSVIGKRSDGGTAIEHVRRDLSFHCCDVDKCNYPMEFMTTTTAPTTMMTTLPTTTLKPLHNCSRDIVFVLDGSTSVGGVNHNYMKTFVQKLIAGLTIGPMDSLVAVVEYSDTARVEWYLTDHTSVRDLENAAINIPYVRGSTGTHAAFYLVHSSVLTARHGARPNAKDVVIILTDGGTDIPDLAVNEAKKLQDDGVTIIAVGVGPNADSQELLQYVKQGHVYNVKYFNTLPYIVSAIASNLCE